MGVDMFICGCCQWVFHNIEEFMLHKNTLCGENNQNRKQVIKMETGNDAENNIQEVDGSTGKVNELPVDDNAIKEETGSGQQIIQVQTAGDGDQSAAQLGQVVQHHIIQLQGPDGLQQLQIANIPGQNIELQDIITALQQGQALTDQDGSVLPTEIQVVVAAKTDGDPALELANMADTGTVISGLGEDVAVSKPARRRGRPRKGEEKNKPAEKVEHIVDTKPKLLERDADGNLTCGRCKKKFSKERHFNTHKCLALSDFVDIMESELINMGDESDSEEGEQMKDADFRAPPALKKPRLEDGSVIIIKPQKESDNCDGNRTDKQDGTMNKTEEVEKPVTCTDKQGDKSVTDGLVTSMEEINDLTKEGLADFPGAGDVKLSQVRVEDGTDEVKLQDTLTAELDGASQEKECYRPRRGRRQKGTTVEISATRQVIKNLPIFKSEEDRIQFEKCANVDLSEVDHLYRQHIINQDINEYAPPLKNRASDKLSVFSCCVCQKIIMTKSHARLHCLTHTNLKPFKCFKCQFATNTKGNLYSHMRKHTGQLYRCSVCQFSTINKGHLIEHEAVHSAQRHECKICHKDYSTVKSLYGHIRRKHGNSKKGKEYMLSISRGHSRGQAILHQCHICNRKFKKKIDRDRHMYMHDIKNNPNVFSCDLCNRTCSRRAYLEKHLMRHRIIYFCCECDQRFPSTLHLTQHLTEVHLSGENKSEELLNEKFEKCIENSIFLPEPDGSMSFDDEFEDGENMMLDGDGAEQEQKPQPGLTDDENAAKGDQIERVEDSQRNSSDINQVEDENNIMESSSNVIPDNVLLAEPEDQGVTEQEITASAEDKQAISVTLEDTNLISSDKDIPGANHDEEASGANITGEEASTGENTNLPASGDSGCGPVVNTSSDGTQDDGENNGGFNDNAMMETSTARSGGENESSPSSQEILYDKQFFRKMGFKALTLNVYNQIRQVFGKEECEFCGRLYFSAADFEHHRRTHTGERPFGCNQCSYRAINKENLRRHIEKEHDKVKFACNKCNFLASNRSQLWSHIQSHKNPDAYTCPACSRTFSQPKTLKIHINITHPDMPEEEVKMATSVQHRARTKIGRKCYRCPHCDRGLFRNGADLQKHIWIHEGIKPFKCPLCPHACRSRNNLASHMIRHSLDKPFLCTECGRAYKSKTALRWHVRSHKDGKFKCPKCTYEATQTSHLKRHMETHEVIKRYVCQHCSYSSNTLGYLKIHYARRHKGQNFTQSNTVTSQVPMVRPMPDNDTKVYRCLSCDYLFGNLSDMKRHLKLRHQIQIDSTNVLEDLTVSVENNDVVPQVLTVNTMNTVDGEGNSEQEAVAEQVVQLRDQLGVTVGTMPTQDDNTSLQPVQYAVSGAEGDDKIQSAVSILQQIIDMSQQGTLGQQEITVKSQDGQPFIVQQQGEVDGTKQNNNQFVIQYVMADGQEVTISEAETQQVINGSEVMTQEDELSQKVKVQQQDMSKLPVDIQNQDMTNLSMEQTVQGLDSTDEHAQPLVLDFDGHSSVNPALPPNLVQMSSIAMEMNSNAEMRTSDGITNVLALEVPADTLTNIN